MKIRGLILTAVVTGGIALSQFAGAGAAHAVGTANGGVWKTTNGDTASVAPGAYVQQNSGPLVTAMLLPAVQAAREAAR